MHGRGDGVLRPSVIGEVERVSPPPGCVRAAELLHLARDYVGESEVARLARACGEKSARLRALLCSDVAEEDDGGAPPPRRAASASDCRAASEPEVLAEALRFVFAAGRARRRLGDGGWREAVTALVPAVDSLLGPLEDGVGSSDRRRGGGSGEAGGKLARRIGRFARETEPVLGAAAPAVAADLLRFCRPAAAWPWAPWVWDGAGGGVVGHVLADRGRPALADAARVYADAGKHLAYLRALWRESVPVDGFALDAWLAAAFAAYAYLVTSVSATEELAGFLPGPAELAARLLGVRPLVRGAGGEARSGLARAAPPAWRAAAEGAAAGAEGERRTAG